MDEVLKILMKRLGEILEQGWSEEDQAAFRKIQKRMETAASTGDEFEINILKNWMREIVRHGAPPSNVASLRKRLVRAAATPDERAVLLRARFGDIVKHPRAQLPNGYYVDSSTFRVFRQGQLRNLPEGLRSPSNGPMVIVWIKEGDRNVATASWHLDASDKGIEVTQRLAKPTDSSEPLIPPEDAARISTALATAFRLVCPQETLIVK